MKKILNFCLLFILSLTVLSCGDDEVIDNNNGGGNSGAGGDDPTVIIIPEKTISLKSAFSSDGIFIEDGKIVIENGTTDQKEVAIDPSALVEIESGYEVVNLKFRTDDILNSNDLPEVGTSSLSSNKLVSLTYKSPSEIMLGTKMAPTKSEYSLEIILKEKSTETLYKSQAIKIVNGWPEGYTQTYHDITMRSVNEMGSPAANFEMYKRVVAKGGEFHEGYATLIGEDRANGGEVAEGRCTGPFKMPTDSDLRTFFGLKNATTIGYGDRIQLGVTIDGSFITTSSVNANTRGIHVGDNQTIVGPNTDRFQSYCFYSIDGSHSVSGVNYDDYDKNPRYFHTANPELWGYDTYAYDHTIARCVYDETKLQKFGVVNPEPENPDGESPVLPQRPTTEPEGERKTITLISLNVYEGLKTDKETNYDNFVAWIIEEAPDVLAMQETNGFTHESLAALAKRFGHNYSVLCREQGYPVSITSKYPITTRSIMLGDYTTTPPKKVLHGGIHVTIQGVNYVVAHLNPFDSHEGLEIVNGEVYRKDEIAYYLENTIEKYPTEPYWLMMGDFNAYSPLDESHYTSQSSRRQYLALQYLLDKGLYRDLFETKAFVSTYPTKIFNDQDEAGDHRIDYVYGDNLLNRNVISAEVLQDEFLDAYTDHYPLKVVFEYNYAE